MIGANPFDGGIGPHISDNGEGAVAELSAQFADGAKPKSKTAPLLIAVIIVLVGVIILGFLYAVPYGRGVRRESLRVFRLALNATGVYARPAISMKLWSPTRGVLRLPSMR